MKFAVTSFILGCLISSAGWKIWVDYISPIQNRENSHFLHEDIQKLHTEFQDFHRVQGHYPKELAHLFEFREVSDDLISISESDWFGGIIFLKEGDDRPYAVIPLRQEAVVLYEKGDWESAFRRRHKE